MLTLQSFLQSIYQWVKSLAVTVSKKMYRSAAVLVTGTAVVTVITLTSTGFSGGGKNALAALSEPEPEEDLLKEAIAEEHELLTQAKVQIQLTDSKQQGRLLVGDLLTKSIQEKLEYKIAVKADITKKRKETLMQTRAKALAESEEAARLAKEKASQMTHIVPYDEDDYQVLLRIVQAEAGICDDKGKILVANVILNRVRSEDFPDNITDVVYQKYQFSPVSNGAINRVKITSQTVDCVNRALKGEDYSNGALYFMYRGGSKAGAVRWFDKRLTYLFQHERHEFFK